LNNNIIIIIVVIMEIYFNSKSKEYNKLSNFYGGVEACFMKDRFINPEIKALFNKFETCDLDKFIYYLKKLQPEKKNWTNAKLNYWFYIDSNNGELIPIRGILSKLAGAAVKDTPTGRRRLNILKRLAKFDGIIEIKEPLSYKDKKTLMICCLNEKFKKKEYRDLLISTGNAILHEKPMRGRGDDWTYPGGDLLGQLLIHVREYIKLI
jgi:hypothetical protein